MNPSYTGAFIEDNDIWYVNFQRLTLNECEWPYQNGERWLHVQGDVASNAHIYVTL